MTLQFIHDNKGNTTGVFIPIDEWQALKSKYTGLQKEEAESTANLTPWQKQILEERLSDYHSNPKDVEDFDEALVEIEQNLK